MARFRIRSLLLLLCLALGLTAAPVTSAAAPPEFFEETVDEVHTIPADELCGFDIDQHLVGTVSFKTQFDRHGTPIRETVHVRLDGSFSANGIVVPYIARVTEHVTLHTDESITVHMTGINGRVVLPGQGLVGATIGHLLLTIPAEGEPTVELIGGQYNEDAFFGTPGQPGLLCELLTL